MLGLAGRIGPPADPADPYGLKTHGDPPAGEALWFLCWAGKWPVEYGSERGTPDAYQRTHYLRVAQALLYAQGEDSVVAPTITCGGQGPNEAAVQEIAADHDTLSGLVSEIKGLDTARRATRTGDLG